jgi:hypothetical protein
MSSTAPSSFSISLGVLQRYVDALIEYGEVSPYRFDVEQTRPHHLKETSLLKTFRPMFL